jgi:serine phosphatase RsbU (regulator of sigma subunit)
MAFRLRTRITLTIEFVTALTIVLMAGSYLVFNFVQITEFYYERGKTLNLLAQSNIEYGMELPGRASRLAGQQAVFTGLLAGKLLTLAEKELYRSPQETSALLRSVLEEGAALRGGDSSETIRVFEADGTPVVSASLPEGGESDAEVGARLAGLMQGKREPVLDMRPDPEYPGSYIYSVCVPLDTTGRFIEMSAGSLLVSAIEDEFSVEDVMTRFLARANVERIAVVNERGEVEALAGESLVPGLSISDDELVAYCVEFLRQLKSSKSPNFVGVHTVQKEDGAALGVVTTLEKSPDGVPRALFIQHETATIAQVIRSAITSVVTVGLVVLLLAALAGMFLGGRLARPLAHLAEGVEVIAKGNFSYRVAEQGYREVRTLARAFNQMVDSIQRSTIELRREAQFRERLESDLRIGAEIQRTLLPERPPEIAGLDQAGWSASARQVGGDFYDLIAIDHGGLALSLGDASGKGIPAALIITECSSTIRALIGERYALGRLMAKVNRALARRLSDSGHFVTLFMAEVIPGDNVMAWTTAGHNPPLFLPASGEPRWLRGEGGLPLGVAEDSEFSDHRMPFHQGDVMVVFSDGITEARNAAGEFYTKERLMALATQQRQVSAEAMASAVRDDVTAFLGGREADDDMTLLVVRRV